ncbi:MAG: isocitrate/isopropylmalate dehydrogenase family protein [Archaeoglobi archaeon]|nr:isocitrate/isopropylmalate dehydrogenase family protein [Candidatus Mnemosynella bozhongmuii]
MKKVAVISGDGIGKEIIPPVSKIISSIAPLELIEIEAGYERWEKCGEAISEDDLEIIKSCDAVFKGPTATPVGRGTYRSVNVALRKFLDLYANVRPVKSYGRQFGALSENIDMVIVRENTEGLYSGIEFSFGEVAQSIKIVTRKGSERVIRFAFEFAKSENRRKVTLVHKANILKETCGLFLEVGREISERYPEIEFEDMIVDAAAMKMVRNPESFDVVVTTNLFGDILSDLALGTVGSIALGGSANIGDRSAMFEPVHGSAPDIAGKGIANPTGALISAGMMLKYLGLRNEGERVLKVLEEILRKGEVLTPDLGGNARTDEFLSHFERKLIG